MSAVPHSAQPERILRELGEVWASLAKEEAEQGKPNVVRACAMTLIVADYESHDSVHVSNTLAELMREHPSRAIVLYISPKVETGLEARVFAQCWKPFGKAQQICCEQINVEATPERWPDVGPTVVGITVPDLPVVVWCRHKAALSVDITSQQRAGFEAVFSLANKVIFDTAGLNAGEAFQKLQQWRSRKRTVADLEWVRLTPWREALAHLFDNPAMLASRKEITDVEISYSGETIPPSAYYLAAWLQRGIAAESRFVKAEGPGKPLQRLRLNGKRPIKMECCKPDLMVLHGGEVDQTFGRSTPSDYALLHEELSIFREDVIYNETLQRAIQLAS